MAERDILFRFLADTRRLQAGGLEARTELARVGQGVEQTGRMLTRTLTPAAVAAGAVFRHAAREWNDGTNAIIAGTGAAGDELVELQGIMRRVAGQVPQSIGEVGMVIAELNTRLGITGPELERMTKKILDLSRITRTDAATNVANITRLFGDWAIATEDQELTLDKLFEATKRTGIGLDRLTTLTVQYGAPLRQLGFGFEEATALLAKFEREGVNTQTVLGALRIGLANMARAGEDPIATFQRVVAEIENAGDAAEANRLAIETFGQRGGPDMAAAIREGRLEIGDLVDQINGAGGAIDDAAERTLTLNDRLRMHRDRVLGIIGPYSEAGMVVAGFAVALGPATTGVGRLMQAVGATPERLAAFRGGLGGVTTFLTGPWGIALGIAAAAVAAFVIRKRQAQERVDEFAASLDDATGALTDNTRELVRNRLEGEGALDAANKLGLSHQLLVEAAMGNTEAQRTLRDHLADTTAGVDAAIASSGQYESELEDLRQAAWTVGQAHHDTRQELLLAQRAQQRARESAADLRGEYDSVGHALRRGVDPALARYITQQGRAEDATGDTEDAVASLRDEYGKYAGEVDSATEAARAFTDEQRAMVDPIFGVDRAMQDLERANQAAKDALDEHGRKSEEYQRAAIDAARAAFDYEASLRTLEAGIADGTVSIAGFERKLDDWVASGFITRQEADRVRARVSVLNAELGRIPGVKNTRFTLGNYSVTLRRVQELDRNLRRVPTNLNIQARMAIAGAGITTPRRQHGGRVWPGHAFTVGEGGPELFVPDRAGTIVPGGRQPGSDGLGELLREQREHGRLLRDLVEAVRDGRVLAVDGDALARVVDERMGVA